MKQIIVQALERERFARYGSYYTLEEPDGYPLSGELHRFFPDRITAAYLGEVGFSPIFVKKPERMIITDVEYHTTTCELILPLNDSMIIHVAPASAGMPVTDLTEAFLVPKHTIVRLNAAIWHLAPLPATVPELHALIILPQCTYANDCTVIRLSNEQQFEIVQREI